MRSSAGTSRSRWRSSRSGAASAAAAARLPPAELPPSDTFAASTPSRSDSDRIQRIDAMTSCTAVGNGYSGANRYSIAKTTHPTDTARCRAVASHTNSSIDPVIQPPPWTIAWAGSRGR